MPRQFGFLIDALEQTYDRVLVAIGPLGADLTTVDLLRTGDSVVLAVEADADDRWGLAAFETLATNGFADVFVTLEPVGRPCSRLRPEGSERSGNAGHSLKRM